MAVEGVMILEGDSRLGCSGRFRRGFPVAYSLGETPARSIAAPVPAGEIDYAAPRHSLAGALSSRCSSLPLRRLPQRLERPSRCRLLVSSHDSRKGVVEEEIAEDEFSSFTMPGLAPDNLTEAVLADIDAFWAGELANLGHDYYGRNGPGHRRRPIKLRTIRPLRQPRGLLPGG